MSSRPLILCLGTTPTLQRTMTFPRVIAGGVNRAREVSQHASGKPLNVARVAHLLGRQSLVIVPLGGARGDAVRADLETSGLAHDIVNVQAETRLCITAIDEQAGTATELIEQHAPLPAEIGNLLLRSLQHHLPHAGMLVLSGSLAPGIADDLYASAIRMAREAGVTTLIDATGSPLLAALSERPDLVKINRMELAETLQSPLPPADLGNAIAHLQSRFGGWLVVTDGPAGSYAGDGRSLWHVASPQIQVVSPIGSGDAYAAGLAAVLIEGIEMPQACRRGAACGAANAVTARAGHLDPALAAELEDQVALTRADAGTRRGP